MLVATPHPARRRPARRWIAAGLLLSAAAAGCGPGRTPAATSSRRPGASPAATTGQPAATTTSAPPAGTHPAATAPPGTRAPARAAARYVFPVQGCPASYAHVHHDYPATDIMTRKGCAYVAPVDGVVDEVSRVDRWDPRSNLGAARGGLSVALVGVDGVRYYGSHLESVAAGIAPGVRVRAGQLLGRVDNSGDARGVPTHVHFGLSWPTRPGIWWIRRGVLYPWPYLDAWRAGRNLSPAAAIRAARARAGSDVPPCAVEC